MGESLKHSKEGKRIPRRFRILLGFALLFVLAALFEAVSSFFLEPVTSVHFMNIGEKELKEEGKEVNTILIGNSTIEEDLDPDRFDDAFGKGTVSLNAATASQEYPYGYLLLQDLFRRYPIKTVVIGVDWVQLGEANGNLFAELVTLDHIKSFDLWIRAAARLTKSVEDIPYLLKSYRYRDKIKNIPSVVSEKLSEDYREGISDVYSRRGYVAVDGNGAEHIEEYVYQFDSDRMNQDALCGLQQMIDLCREKGAEVYLVNMVTNSASIAASPDLQKAHDWLAEFAEKNGVAYIDFNLLRDRTELVPEEDFALSDHVDRDRAGAYTQRVGEILAKVRDGESISEDFYGSYEEVVEDLSGILILTLERTDNGDGTVTLTSEAAVHPDEEVFYSFYKLEDGKETLLQDYSARNTCSISADEVHEGDIFGVKIRDAERRTRTRERKVIPGGWTDKYD